MLVIPKPKETFDFQLEGTDTIYSIPFAKDLPIDYTQRLAALADADAVEVLDLLHEVMERYAPGAWDGLTQEGLALILAAWGEGMGEQQPRRS